MQQRRPNAAKNKINNFKKKSDQWFPEWVLKGGREIHYLDYVDGFTGVYMCHKTSNCTLFLFLKYLFIYLFIYLGCTGSLVAARRIF